MLSRAWQHLAAGAGRGRSRSVGVVLRASATTNQMPAGTANHLATRATNEDAWPHAPPISGPSSGEPSERRGSPFFVRVEQEKAPGVTGGR